MDGRRDPGVHPARSPWLAFIDQTAHDGFEDVCWFEAGMNVYVLSSIDLDISETGTIPSTSTGAVAVSH